MFWMSRRGILTCAVALSSACSRASGLPAHTGEDRAASTAPALATAPDRYLSSGSVRLRYREVGSGPAIVMLHGYTDRVEMWAGPADSLARDYRVVAPDLRGFGLSDKPAAPGSYGRAMTEDVVALLDSLGVERAGLVGYSLGALVAADFAVRHPTRVASVLLIAGPFAADSSALAAELAPYVAELERGEGLGGFFRYILPTLPDSVVTAMAGQMYAENDRAALTGSLREMAALIHPDRELEALRVPAVVLVGRADPMRGPARWVADRWPGIRLVELPGADHSVVFADPEVTAQARWLGQAAVR